MIIKNDLYINYYDHYDSDYAYINFVENISSYKKYIYSSKILKPKVEQIEGKKKIKINITSISYILYPNIVKYYIIINALSYNFHHYTFDPLYSILTKKRQINKSNNEFMTIIEDKAIKEFFECEIAIDTDLREDKENDINIIPVGNENNLVELNYMMTGKFKYKNLKSNERQQHL